MIHKLVDFLKEKCGPKTVNKLLDKQCAGGQVFCGCSGSGLNPKVFCFVLRMHVALLCVCINLIWLWPCCLEWKGHCLDLFEGKSKLWETFLKAMAKPQESVNFHFQKKALHSGGSQKTKQRKIQNKQITRMHASPSPVSTLWIYPGVQCQD